MFFDFFQINLLKLLYTFLSWRCNTKIRTIQRSNVHWKRLSFISIGRFIIVGVKFFCTIIILLISTSRMSFSYNFGLGHFLSLFLLLLGKFLDFLKLFCFLLSFFNLSFISFNYFWKVAKNLKCLLEAFDILLLFFHLNIIECNQRLNFGINLINMKFCHFEKKELNWKIFYFH